MVDHSLNGLELELTIVRFRRDRDRDVLQVTDVSHGHAVWCVGHVELQGLLHWVGAREECC